MNEVACLSLATSPEVQSDWENFFSERGLKLIIHAADTIPEARNIARLPSVFFALGHLSDPARAGSSLSTTSTIHQLSFPPLVMVASQPLTSEQREALRLQGVSYVVTHPIDGDRDTPVLDALLRSRQWLSGRLEQMSLADVLQMLGQKGHTALVTVSLGASGDISHTPWESAERGQAEEETGWCGRVYLRGGYLVRAETPRRRGIEALAELLELPAGRFRIHEVALPPKEANLNGSIESNLMNAAVLVDHQGSEIPEQPTLRKAPPPSPPPDLTVSRPAEPAPEDSTEAPLARPPKNGDGGTFTLEKTLRSISLLRGIARSDSDANILESAGDMEADTAAAIAVMSQEPLETIGAVLGMGAVQGWGIVSDSASLFVQTTSEGYVVASGGSDDAPEVTLKKMVSAFGDRL